MIALHESVAGVEHRSPDPVEPVGSQPRALVLEDEEDLSELWATILLEDGYDVVCRESALGLAALLRRWRPDVILLDLGLPYRSGAVLLADFKADPATAGIPIVVLSAAPDCLPPARAALAAAVLTKPVATQTLLATVGATQPGRHHGGAAPVLPAGAGSDAAGVADPCAGDASRSRRVRQRRSRPLPDEYFADGVFAPEGAELLRSYTCVRCGDQAATWEAFRRHRAACDRVGPAPERDPLHSAPLAGIRALERWRRRQQRQPRSAWRPRRTPGPANR